MLKYEFENGVAHWICMTARGFERAMRSELVPEGITHRQCQVLAWLALKGSLSQVELAERMNIEPATLVSVIDRMERDGLLARESDPDDRRRKMIKPLPKAEPVWKKVSVCAERVQARATKGMTKKQLKTLTELLQIVEANLGTSKPVMQVV